jgi:hypothetical protein
MKHLLALAIAASMTLWAASADAKAGGYHLMRPHVAKSDTPAPGHMQTSPNQAKIDNGSIDGTLNPVTAKPGTKSQ